VAGSFRKEGQTVRPGALPLPQLILLDVVSPPVIAGIWWLMSGGWAAGVQGGSTSTETKSRQTLEFWAILILLYVMAFGVTIYAWLT